jgi:hypothetical protein
MAEQAGVSYPTVRSRLDKVIDALRQEIVQAGRVCGTSPGRESDGTMSSDEAAKIIKSV